MRLGTLASQTLFLSGTHFAVRLVGLFLRVWLSRELGAQAMGLVELAQSAQMLLITPVVSGLPAAVSRMCAKAQPGQQARVLRCGLLLALAVSVPLTVLAFALRVPLALWLGDIRTLPALLCYLPCIPVLGASCALNGYYYGTGRPVPPALCELLEQVVRLTLTLRLVALTRGFPLLLRAAVPSLAALLGETLALAAMLIIALRAMICPRGEGSRRLILREMLALALPLTGMRLVTSLMRTVQSALIPARLQAAGLGGAEALAHLGMLNGMLMPVLMIPSFITCSLCTVAAPELTRRQASGRPQRPLVRRVLLSTLGVGLLAMAAVYLCAPLLAGRLYRQPALEPLLRRCCALVPVMALTQVTGGLMNGLGLQGRSLRIAVAANLLGTVLMYALVALPGAGLYGAVVALAAAQALTLAASLRALLGAAA